MHHGSPTYIDRHDITTDPAFRHRQGPECGTHLAALRKTLRNTGRLDPVLAWQEVDAKEQATGRLILLDGHYRLAAYRAEQSAGKIAGRGIPATILLGSRIEARLASLSANAKDTQPLTAKERLNAAWGLVQEYRNEISKPRLAKASGVAERTIANMRKQLKHFTDAQDVPTGDWLIDRRFPVKGDYPAPSDEERQKMVSTLSTAFRATLSKNRTSDYEIIGDALTEALGARRLAFVIDYLAGTDGDRETAWLVPDIAEGGVVNAENQAHEDF